ncbi:hypothetical protein JCM16358_24140 [Halanaerocella petrolearia]
MTKEPVRRIVKPLGIMFSEYYFYLVASFCNSEDDFKIVYRLDRIVDYKITDQNFSVKYIDRFQEGEFRKRVQFMQPGNLTKIKFRFWGRSLEAVLDRLPTAQVTAKEDDAYTVQAEVYGRGIKMWLLSQGPTLEVLEPIELREEMKEMAQNILEIY